MAESGYSIEKGMDPSSGRHRYFVTKDGKRQLSFLSKDDAELWIRRATKTANASFETGRLRAQNAIAQRMGNARDVHIDYKDVDGTKKRAIIPGAEAMTYSTKDYYTAAKLWLAAKHPGAKLGMVSA